MRTWPPGASRVSEASSDPWCATIGRRPTATTDGTETCDESTSLDDRRRHRCCDPGLGRVDRRPRRRLRKRRQRAIRRSPPPPCPHPPCRRQPPQRLPHPPQRLRPPLLSPLPLPLLVRIPHRQPQARPGRMPHRLRAATRQRPSTRWPISRSPPGSSTCRSRRSVPGSRRLARATICVSRWSH